MATFDKNYMLEHPDDIIDAWFDWYFDQGNIPTEINDVVNPRPSLSDVSMLLEETDSKHEQAVSLFEAGDYQAAIEILKEEVDYLCLARNLGDSSDVREYIDFFYGNTLFKIGSATYLQHFSDHDPFESEITPFEYETLMEAIEFFEAAKYFLDPNLDFEMFYIADDFSQHCQEVVLKFSEVDSPKTI